MSRRVVRRMPHRRGRESERDHDIAAQALLAVDGICANGVDVDVLPGPLGVLLYPRAAVVLVGDQSA